MKKALIYLGVTAALNIIFRLISRNSLAFSEWYATVVYPLISGILARITGVFPFALAEILLYIMILLILTGFVFFTIRLIKSSGRRVKVLLFSLVALSCTVSTFMAVFLFNCGINYHRQTFFYYSGLTIDLYDNEDLRGVIDEVIGELYEIIPHITTGEQGQFIMTPDKLNPTVRSSMNKLGEIYPVLDAYYPNPKPMLLSMQILTPTLTCGIFSPFTMEAIYNADMPHSQIPFTVSHELSHLAGFMREDEANFIAFLACRESGDFDFMYSGYTNALVYLLNAFLEESEWEEYSEMYMTIPEQVRTEYNYTMNYWHPPRETSFSTAVSEIVSSAAGTVNDAYLKSQGQSDGVKSYGRLVDLMIADYIERNKTDY
ncbi:MAG: DUF3810 domain-containing protein [Oscillospiraceae bacterium]|nr:DUF3810 domain-containing protein [Oscillospiraceae bacterium]